MSTVEVAAKARLTPGYVALALDAGLLAGRVHLQRGRPVYAADAAEHLRRVARWAFLASLPDDQCKRVIATILAPMRQQRQPA
jgi:hypothetical protein